MIEIFNLRLENCDDGVRVIGQITFIPQFTNKAIDRHFFDRENAIIYMREECKQCFWSVFDRLTIYCNDIMLSGDNRFSQMKSDYILKLRKVHDFIGENDLDVIQVCRLFVAAKDDFMKILPPANHPIHDRLRSMINRATEQARFYQIEFSKPYQYQFHTVKAAS